MVYNILVTSWVRTSTSCFKQMHAITTHNQCVYLIFKLINSVKCTWKFFKNLVAQRYYLCFLIRRTNIFLLVIVNRITVMQNHMEIDAGIILFISSRVLLQCRFTKNLLSGYNGFSLSNENNWDNIPAREINRIWVWKCHRCVCDYWTKKKIIHYSTYLCGFWITFDCLSMAQSISFHFLRIWMLGTCTIRLITWLVCAKP